MIVLTTQNQVDKLKSDGSYPFFEIASFTVAELSEHSNLDLLPDLLGELTEVSDGFNYFYTNVKHPECCVLLDINYDKVKVLSTFPDVAPFVLPQAEPVEVIGKAHLSGEGSWKSIITTVQEGLLEALNAYMTNQD